MDCYSAESEFIESLDFLSPPVKRINSSRQAFSSVKGKDANDVHLKSDLRKNLIGLAPGLTLNTKPVKISESSTSLILKKTTEGQILGQQYSVVSFPSLYQPEKNNSTLLKSQKKTNPSEKPLIKVTVIPKTDSIQAAKLLRRRRQKPTKVQSTSSNHENCIQTKNVFLIVAGRRKEKIYEIKTTGSAKLSNDHDTHSKHEDIPLAELSGFKHLLESLDMDKKKKKEKKAAVDTSDVHQTKEREKFSQCNNCVCVREIPESPKTPKRGRVRIFGQFGITGDDKYVLKYGATVNDKEVISDVAQLTREFSPIIAETSHGTTEEPSVQQQDSCLQADYDYELDMEKPPVTDTVSKETQGTQVNFNVQVASNQARSTTFSDKKTQCSCCGNKSDNNTLKDCQSPMVIISVYPKSSPEDLMKSFQSPPVNTRSASPVITNMYSSNQVLRTEKAPNKSDTRRNYKSPLMSRSPSPVKKVSRPKVPDDSNKDQFSEKRNPDNQKALKAIKDKIREKDKLKQESPRKLPLKSTNATQGSKNLQNGTVSTASQVSKRNQRNITYQATQVSDKKYQPANSANGRQAQVSPTRIKNYTVTNGTQYSNEFNSTQCENNFGSLRRRSPPTKLRRTQESNAAQIPIVLYTSHATQVSRSGPLMNSCATQVSIPRPNAITLRMSQNQETSVLPGFRIEQTPRLIQKTKADSGTNTEQARAKKALVETYTKKLSEQMYQHDYIPARFDNSKVTINIHGDREFYNVLFDQDNLSAGLTIRKTMKDMGVPNVINESPLGSLLPLSDCVERGRLNSGNNSPTRSPSLLCHNPSDDDLLKLGSRLSIHDIRDSLEICHRREDKSIYNNPKNSKTGFTAHLADNVPEDSEFSAKMKHFPGDDCSISDPIARDKQIRELLGVDNVKASKACQCLCCDNNVEIPYQYNYWQQCKESQVTEINYGLHTLCPCFDSIRQKEKASVAVQCRKKNCKACLHKQNSVGEYEDTDGQSPIYQQLLLNRHTQVFLRAEKISKQKPIILSRNQYDKVKRIIQKTISIKKSSPVKRSNLLLRIKSSEISIGEVRIKKVKDPELPQKEAKDQTPEITDKCMCEQANPISCCCKPYCTHFDKTGGKSRSRKPTADIDMKRDYSSGESSDRDETELKKNKIKEVPERQAICKPYAETFAERDYRRVGKGNVYRKEELIANKDMQKPRPELNEERDAGVNKANIAGKKRLMAEKDMHTSRTELNEERDVEVNKANVTGKERIIAKKGMHKPRPELNEERDIGVNKGNMSGKERIIVTKGMHKLRPEINEERDIEVNKGNVSGKERIIAKKDMHIPRPELNEVRDVEVNKANVSGKERIIAKKDKHTSRPELNEERDIGVNKGNVSGKERTIAKKDMHKPRPELNEKRDIEVNKANVSGKERTIAKEDMHKPRPELNEERDIEVNKAKVVGKERLSAVKDSSGSCASDNIELEVNHSDIKTFVLFNAEHNRGNFEDPKETEHVAHTRRTMSSVQIRYASIAYMKQLASSSTDVGAISDSSLCHLNSFQTLFRGHRKSATPNLGTSAYSLYSADGNNLENKCVNLEQQDSKPKKPFLRRLMSCLVMRSTIDSELKPPVRPPRPNLPSVNSSFDSYHISTSLAAVEVSSSIYDTSASFYSNHSIHPINSKIIKRGFFSSVRGFLTNRKS